MTQALCLYSCPLPLTEELVVQDLDEGGEVVAVLVLHRDQVVQGLREVLEQEAPEATHLQGGRGGAGGGAGNSGGAQQQ